MDLAGLSNQQLMAVASGLPPKIDFSSLEREHDLPSGTLSAVMKQESGGKPDAISPKGAVGLFQFMPETAKQLGIDPSDPQQSAIGAATYLGRLKQKFGSMNKALAAYNWGPGNVEKYGIQRLPPETANYVQSIGEKIGISGNQNAVNPLDLNKASNDDLAKIAGINPELLKNKSNAPSSSFNDSNILPNNQNTPNSGADLGRGYAAVSGFNSAIPFGNRITAGIGSVLASPFSDKSTGELYDQMRAEQASTNAIHPGAHLAGTVGGLAATLPLALENAGSSAMAGSGGIRGAVSAIPEAAGQVGNWVRGAELAPEASNLAKAGNLAARSIKSGAVAAPVGALYGAGDAPEGKQIQGAEQGAAMAGGISAALPVAGAALGAAGGLIPGVDAGLAKVAQLAKDHGIPLSLDQISNSPLLKNIQKISQELPFSGQADFRAQQMKAFNKALFKTVGIDADVFTPETMDKAFSKVGGEFDDLTKGKTFTLGDSFVKNLAEKADDVESQYGSEAAKIYQKEALKVIDDISSGDEIPGELLGRQRARINALARNAAPGISNGLHDLENVLIDGITSGDAATQEALTQAKYRYKNLLALEPIANKAKGGFINPTLLNNRVSQIYGRQYTRGNAGDIGDLAKVGYELLPQLGGSDTTQKLLTAGALVGGAANPSVAVPAATAVAANRGFQSLVNRNQSLVKMILENPKATLPLISKLPPKDAQQILSQVAAESQTGGQQ